MSFNFKRIAQSFFAVGIAVGLVFSATACSQTALPETDQEFGKNPTVVENTIKTLDNAKSIHLKKKAFSIGDSWTVEADGEEVATIKGRTLPVLGDTYSMYATDGTFVAAEQEQLKILSGAKADTYDYEAKKNGTINAQVLSIGYRFNISDKNGNKVGSFKQGLSLMLSGNIYNAQGDSEWKMDKGFSLGASITLDNQGGKSNKVSALNAIWVATIVNEVAEADSAKSSSK